MTARTFCSRHLLVWPACVTIACVAMVEPPSSAAPTSLPTSRPAAQIILTKESPTELARRVIIVDGHIDLPYRLEEGRNGDGELTEDPTERTENGQMDLVRALEGGLDAPFMSIYVPARFQKTGGAKKMADRLIDLVEGLAARAPERWAIAKSPADIEANHAAGRVSLPLGIENGAALEDDLANVAHFAGRGVGYITLTHSKDNLICDSSYDDTRTWKGLSPYGREVVEAMNREGIMVDISHVSDETFEQVMAITKVPVIASHSSSRHFTPGWQRNMSDAMIRKLADNGGVIMVAFGSSFLSDDARLDWQRKKATIAKRAEAEGWTAESEAYIAFRKKFLADNPRQLASIEDVADHIDHIVKLVGVDHVGLGSDFDGVGDSLPIGLEDVSAYPRLIKVLLDRGYSKPEIAKICGGNLLRVWRTVQAFADRLPPPPSP